MPLFEYACNTCGDEGETLASAWSVAKCNRCDSLDLRRLHSTFSILTPGAMAREGSEIENRGAQELTTISQLAAKLGMKPGRLAHRAKSLGLQEAARSGSLTVQEVALLELTRNEPMAELAKRRRDLEKGRIVAVAPRSSGAPTPATVRVTVDTLPPQEEAPANGTTPDVADDVDSADVPTEDPPERMPGNLEALRGAQPDQTGKRLEEIELHIQDLQERIGRLTLSLERQQQQTADSANLMDAILEELAAVEHRLEHPPWPAKFQKLQERIRNITAATRTPAEPRWPEQPIQELTDKLRARGFLISDDTVARIWSALRSARIVVLQGAPGTGKSTLAKYLPEILLPPFGELSRTFIQMDKDITFDLAIGGRTITADDRIGPELGFLSEAVVACHESADGHWLIIDEFNRGDIDALLTPLLDALSAEKGALQHPHMFPDESQESAVLPIPSSFRIIGTMNPFDQRLWSLSSALNERIAYVDIPSLPLEEETELVMRRVVEPWLAERPRERSREAASQLCDELCSVARAIRTLASREPRRQYASCVLGSRIIMNAVQGALSLFETGHDPAMDAIPGIVDQQVSDRILVSSMNDAERAVREALLNEVFSVERFPVTCRRLRDGIADLVDD